MVWKDRECSEREGITIEYNTENASYEYWLHTLDGIGKKTIAELLAQFGSAKEIYLTAEDKLRRYLRADRLAALEESRKRRDVKREYEALAEKGVSFYTSAHPDYPDRLRKLPDAPAALYCIGSLPPEMRPSVALVGARNCSSYGSYMAEEIGKVMAEAGISVISGMARGIDGLAQRAAMRAGGQTYGVLGCGVLICYPEENRPLYEAMKERGGIISEYRPDTLPKAGQFPPRNRIISGLAEAVIVIEAKEKSGTCITVDMALEQGKEVYAVPGRICDELSRGCNRLIGQGAGIVTEPSKLPEQLFGLRGKYRAESGNDFGQPEHAGQSDCSTRKNGVSLSPIQRRILEAMGSAPTQTDIIYAALKRHQENSALTIAVLRKELLDMTVKGYVRAVGGSYFERILYNA